MQTLATATALIAALGLSVHERAWDVLPTPAETLWGVIDPATGFVIGFDTDREAAIVSAADSLSDMATRRGTTPSELLDEIRFSLQR